MTERILLKDLDGNLIGELSIYKKFNLEFVEELDMSFNKKQYGKQYNDEKGVIKNSEPIMVFKKVK